MSDEIKGVSFQPGAGQLSGNASPAEQGNGTQEYVTKETFALSLKELQAELERRVQSLTDKAGSRIETRVQERLAEIDRNAKRFDVDPERVRAAKQEAVMEELARVPEAAASPHQPAQVGKQEQPPTDAVMAAASRMWAQDLEEEMGVSLSESDPEALVLNNAKSFAEWKAAYRQALANKQQRASIPSAARVPSLGGGGLPVDKTTMLAELESLLVQPSKATLPRIKELRAKLNQ